MEPTPDILSHEQTATPKRQAGTPPGTVTHPPETKAVARLRPHKTTSYLIPEPPRDAINFSTDSPQKALFSPLAPRWQQSSRITGTPAPGPPAGRRRGFPSAGAV